MCQECVHLEQKNKMWDLMGGLLTIEIEGLVVFPITLDYVAGYVDVYFKNEYIGCVKELEMSAPAVWADHLGVETNDLMVAVTNVVYHWLVK